MNTLKNLFDLPTPLPTKEELFETLFSQENLLIERIISTGQSTPEGKWYEQEKNEWVVLLQGEATLEYKDKTRESTQLKKGDHLFIPALQKHRVAATSTNPPCIWLALHFAPAARP